jgi:hypothetical protein
MSTSIFNASSSATHSSFTPSRVRLWTGRVIYGITVLLLGLDVSVKLAMSAQAVQGSAPLGFTPQHVLIIGCIGFVCLVTYLIPRTRILGALLWTGYFGGTVVTHLRVGNPLFTHILCGVYLGIFIWGSLYLFDPRVRTIIAPAR